MVLSCDGKGIVMRADALRPATQEQAAVTTTKLAGRLSKGEKHNRRPMAEVGTVYDATPTPRTLADVLPENDEQRAAAIPGPVATNKWLVASVADEAATVVAQVLR